MDSPESTPAPAPAPRGSTPEPVTPPAPDAPASPAPLVVAPVEVAPEATSTAVAPPRPRVKRGLALHERVAQERDAAAAHRRRLALRVLPMVTASLGALALGVWLVRAPVLRALARSRPALTAWATERLAESRDPESFDLYVQELGRADADHAGYFRLVFLLGGRAGLPSTDEDPILPEDPAAVEAHLGVLRAALQDARPDASRGALYALSALAERPWARRTDLLDLAAGQLASRDLVTRRYAAMALEVRPPPSTFDALAAAVRADPDGLVRRFAARALGASGEAKNGAALSLALADPAPEVRREALLALVRLGVGDNLERVEAAYRSDPDGAGRAEVLDALGACRDPGTTPLLVEGARDSAPAGRAAALRALGPRPEAAAHRALVEGLADPDASVRAAAAAGLAARSDAADAVPALVAALERPGEWSVVREVHSALARLTGASVEAPEQESPETWPRAARSWAAWLTARGGAR